MHSADASSFEPVRLLRNFVNSSPWITTSILAHVIAIAVLGVIYLGHEKAPELAQEPTLLTMSAPRIEAPEPPVKEPERFDRESMPVAIETEKESDKESDFVTEVVYEPELEPGRHGEYFPESRDPSLEAGILNPQPDAPHELLAGAIGGTAIGVGIGGHFGETSPYSSRLKGGGGIGGGGTGDGLDKGGLNTKAHGNPKVAVLAALRWLARHQSPDGRWDCDGFDAQCRENKCEGRGEATYDPGVTGLALLCFLGAGITPQHGPEEFRRVVRNGLTYLKSVQTEEGLFGPQTSQHYQYNHACAALAMAEGFGMTQANMFRESAQSGVGWVLRSKNPYQAWRYGVADGDNDTSITGWMAMVLKSATLSGLDSEQQALIDAAAWVDEMTDPMTGRTGYQTKGTGPARTQGPAMEQFPAENSEALTAVGMLVRIFAGHKASDDPQILKGADLLLQRLPKWDPPHVDFYYWYYGALAMYQVGGTPWERWNEAMKSAILDHQRLDESQDEHGSWDPIDPWSPEGGRVYSTALNCLCMEVYYRYGRVFGTSLEATQSGAPKVPVQTTPDGRQPQGQ